MTSSVSPVCPVMCCTCVPLLIPVYLRLLVQPAGGLVFGESTVSERLSLLTLSVQATNLIGVSLVQFVVKNKS